MYKLIIMNVKLTLKIIGAIQVFILLLLIILEQGDFTCIWEYYQVTVVIQVIIAFCIWLVKKVGLGNIFDFILNYDDYDED